MIYIAFFFYYTYSLIKLLGISAICMTLLQRLSYNTCYSDKSDHANMLYLLK